MKHVPIQILVYQAELIINKNLIGKSFTTLYETNILKKDTLNDYVPTSSNE